MAPSSAQTTSHETVRHEGHFKGYQGRELFFQSWSSRRAEPARGTLVITHGIGEHSECYHRTAEALAPLGWEIYAWDLRGHGRSDGKRGYVANFVDYARDLGFFLRHLKATGKLDGPFALIGHSMGGLITLRHLLDEERDTPEPTALVLSSPLLGVALKVPVVKDVAARVLNHLLPSLTLFSEVKYEALTRDPEFLRGYETDSLRHEKISPAVYLGMLENMEFAKKNAAHLRFPTLIQASGVDRIVSLEATKEFFPLIGAKEKQLIVYDDSYHEIYNDLDRAKVFNDLNAFLEKHLVKGEK